jgi:nitroreductase
MDTYETIRTVLAVRGYQSKPIPPQVVHRILEAGRLTGSAMNKQPWHFIVVEEPETIRNLGALARTGPYTAQAPLVIVVAVEDGRFALSDASRAIQSMILAAWSEGVGSNWVGFQGMDEVRSLLGIPAQLDVIALLPFGYPVKTVGKGKKKRKALAEVAHRGKFGQPYQ